MAAPIHTYWFTKRGVLELNEKLRGPPATQRIREISRDLTGAQRTVLTNKRSDSGARSWPPCFRRTRPMVERHLLNYPLPVGPQSVCKPHGSIGERALLEDSARTTSDSVRGLCSATWRCRRS